MTISKTAAIEHARKFAESICGSGNYQVPLTEQGANDLFDFIETYASRIIRSAEEQDQKQ